MFFGRKKQMDDLMALWRKRASSFVTCRGRRRIGKSTLIEKFAECSDSHFIKIEGLRPGEGVDNVAQLMNFAEQLSAQTGSDDTPPANWLQAFIRLDREIRDEGRTVVLFDEISWMAQYDDTFAGKLKIAWDNYLRKHPRLILVICGSVSMWIKEHVIDDTAFFGRRSLDIVVPEMELSDCVSFWGKAANRIDRREILDVLSVVGGVPRYLEEIDPGASANENIRRLAFRPKGVLREDFDAMFKDVITRQSTLAGLILRTLVSGAKNISEIAAELGLEKNGHFSRALEQLEEAGLVSSDEGKNPASGKDAHGSFYRLRDNYSRFYLRYVEPVSKSVDRGDFELGSLDALEGWEVVKGLAFENMVVNNARKIIELLGLGGAHVTSAVPYRRGGSKNGKRKGVQVDLLVQTRRSIHLVEVKRQREIGREVIAEMEEKVKLVPHPEGVSLRTALVYEGNLASVVEADGYFDALVPFRNVLDF